jgi:hypothetical protein
VKRGSTGVGDELGWRGKEVLCGDFIIVEADWSHSSL